MLEKVWQYPVGHDLAGSGAPATLIWDPLCGLEVKSLITGALSQFANAPTSANWLGGFFRRVLQRKVWAR